MTARKPLVMSGGQIRQLAAGDTLDVAASLAHGTSWPAAPSTNDWFAHDTLGVVARWDGTRWLGQPEPLIGTPWWNAAMPLSAAQSIPFQFPSSPAFNAILHRVTYMVQVDSINNASNYWRIEIASISGGLITHNTSTLSPSVSAPISFTDTTTRTFNGVYIWCDKVGTPGVMYLAQSIFIRKVYT